MTSGPMLTDLCLCALTLFADPGWSRLDTTFLDMDPPLMSWSMTDAEYNEWEAKEYEQLGRPLVTGRTKRHGDHALPLVRDARPSDMGRGDGSCGEVKASLWGANLRLR